MEPTDLPAHKSLEPQNPSIDPRTSFAGKKLPGRNLIICCDGTNNQFGPENTNVVRLIQALDRDPARQRIYYDPGVGTLAEPGALTAFTKTISKWWGLAFGAGLPWKVQEAYSFLMETWEPGDQVFIFGFSRGAYSARVLAGMLHALGLLPRGNDNLVPYVMRLYQGVRDERTVTEGTDKAKPWKDLCDQFRWTFSKQVFPGDDERRFPVHFMGLWDTVSSVGWVWDPARFPYTANNPSAKIIRHAVSIDERRWFFRQNLLKQADGQDLKEYWFAGVHSDIGGGYPESSGVPPLYSRLWRIPFEWVLKDAVDVAGLLIDPDRLAQVLGKSPATETPWKDPQHESLTPGWWPAEFFPKVAWNSDKKANEVQVGLGRHRPIPDGAKIHHSVLRRIRDQDVGYAPPNFSPAFLTKIRGSEVNEETISFDE